MKLTPVLCSLVLLPAPALAVQAGAAAGPVQGPEVRGFVARIQLAGRSLAQRPHFEYVRAFNEGEPIEVRLDPARFPELIGEKAYVYVVASKTSAEWDADPTLVDVTAGLELISFPRVGAQPEVVTADTGTLRGDAGTGLGVGFDVVLDVDASGTLNAGDFIDGYGPESGLYVVHDVTLPGPLAVTEIQYSGGTFLGQNTYYPTDIATLGQLPLVVVSHGNGHNFQWYDHIGYHLASYGYVVMSHQNNTMPGTETASTTTLTNTDYFLSSLDLIDGGTLAGHVDGSRITWIGHSRGGEGVARAYDRLYDGDYTPQAFTIDDIVLVSSIAPTDFQGTDRTNPHDVPFHLWTGGADADVTGCAFTDIVQTFHLHERAEQYRQSISLHGVGHGDFHDGPTGSVAVGFCKVGRADTHTIMRGHLLPLVHHYVQGNVPAKDFLWRQWEAFRPVGAPDENPCVVVDLMYQEGSTSGKRVIDDFQSNFSDLLSSSGGEVRYTVDTLLEDRLDDGNIHFTQQLADPMNGMTLAGANDTSRGLVFDFAADGYILFEIPADQRNWQSFEYLSFRACQVTRHPRTAAEDGDLTFTVTLHDGAGRTSSINFGAYGGGIEEPYMRARCGLPPLGWANEWETIRMRLTDFVDHTGKRPGSISVGGTGTAALNLNDVAALEFRFGPSWGSPIGRVGLDEIELTRD